MYIDKITLTNIRGFKHLDFSLARPDGSYAGWTVFTGDNGGGKSTLLKAVALGIKGYDVFPLLTSTNGWISSGTQYAQIVLSIYDPLPIKKMISLPWVFTLINYGESKRLHISSKAPPLYGSETQDGNEAIVLPNNTFSCGYGPYRRIFGSSAETAHFMKSPNTAPFVTLFQESASLAEVDQWMRLLSHKALEKKPNAQATLDILLGILGDDFLPNDITIDRIDSDGLWLKDKNGLQLSWDDMSDGYRSALVLLADILRHMIETYGVEDLTGVDADGKLIIKRGGVVLIDEIDTHLHPSWQREIGFWLKKHFPEIQFLVTTHSPIICQAADPNGIFVLPWPASGDVRRPMSPAEYQRIIASTSDGILLTDAFGLENTRSDDAVTHRARYSRLKAKASAGAVLSPAESHDLKALQAFVAAGDR